MDPILLHKQLRENTEDLSKYMKDLNEWEKEMKRKEKELYGDTNDGEADETLPPVRSKVKKNCVNKLKSDETEKPSPPRIKSNDYSGWEKFDVEKACEEVEKVAVSSPVPSPAPVKSDADIQEAVYEKENGNKFVKLGKWKEAIECYTRAISHDASNAIFYANRAQCALKLKQWQQVVDDCGKALTIEPGYVKALLRRGTAYMNLQNYTFAIDDLREVIKLEPGNKEARAFLQTSIKAKTAQKPSKPSPKKDNVIAAISKPIHLRSKAPLRRVPIEEIGADLHKSPIVEIEPSDPLQTSSKTIEVQEQPADEPKSIPKQPVSTVPKQPKSKNLPKPEPLKTDYVETLPPAPKSAVQFMLAWNQLRPQSHYAYLQQLRGNNLSRIFGDSLESKHLTELLAALNSAPPEAAVFEYLEGLTQTRRFSTLALFMSKQDKSVVKSLLEKCKSENQCTEEQLTKLERLYEL